MISGRRGALLHPVVVACLAPILLVQTARAGAFLFASDGNDVDVIAHPVGYTGSGGKLDVTVCVDPGSPNADEMLLSLDNVVERFNELQPQTGNLASGTNNNVPNGRIDFESVLLHEVGHCIGLAHVNLASESGLTGDDRNYTKSTDGGDGYDLDRGADLVRGSLDDMRGNDENLHWFRKLDNNPFDIAAVVDTTTYSRDLADLPAGHGFAANGDRAVAIALGVPGTEAVMQQGTFTDEAQRELAHDDVATLRLAMSGLDEREGGGDDYTLNLISLGKAASCDLIIAFDDQQTDFAQCDVFGAYASFPDHVRIVNPRIYFNDQYSWFFNDQPATGCGSGQIEVGEDCDDGNPFDGDGCSSTCTIEPGFVCTGDPSSCTAICGDGLVLGNETCDDGGHVDGDCCGASCQLEPPGSPCADDLNECTADQCDAQGSCVHLPLSIACDDLDVCTTFSWCIEGACTGFNPIDCDDGLFCNGPETCDAIAGCQPGSLDLDDGVACTVDGCDEEGDEITHLPDPLACDDGDACTADACDQIDGCSNTPIVGPDPDGDGIPEVCDNCPGFFNPGQQDADGNGTGDSCEGPPIPAAGPVLQRLLMAVLLISGAVAFRWQSSRPRSRQP